MTNFIHRIEKFGHEFASALHSGISMSGFIFLQMALFFAPITLNIYLVGALIVTDIFTALIALFMQKKKESATIRSAFSEFYKSWTSKRAFDSIPKFVWYAILVLLSYMVGTIFSEPLKVANLATGVIAYVEFRSIIENGDKAFGTNIWELIVDGAAKFFKLK